MQGLILSAPSSGCGKTTVTLGLLRALSRRAVPVRGAKSGPDYIDPRFHEAACAQPCLNLDGWAMTPDRIRALAATKGSEGQNTDTLLLIEGAMGLFDGAPPDGKGASADLARILGLPVVLVVDAGRMAQSVAPLVQGFARHDPKVQVAGVILNRVGSPRHDRMLRRALAPLGPDLPVLGALPRDGAIAHPSRHLGLVQAQERPDLDRFLDHAADLVEQHIDLPALTGLARALRPLAPRPPNAHRMSPPAQVIAMAQDAAFAFAYPHLLADWRALGAEIRPFSPLADDPVPPADLVFLPGGYPELHAGRLAGNQRFLASLRQAAQTTRIYGECGGYMMLGDGLIDAEGTRHEMAGLLPLVTSFAKRKLSLGYRKLHRAKAAAGAMGAPLAFPDGGFPAGAWMAHEFHYATTLRADGPPLFTAQDAEGQDLPPMGLVQGRVFGSFAHVIDRAID